MNLLKFVFQRKYKTLGRIKGGKWLTSVFIE